MATVSSFSTMPRKKFPSLLFCPILSGAPTAATQQAAAKMCFQPLQVAATVLKQLRHDWCQPCQPSLNPTRFLAAERYTRLSTHSMLMPTHPIKQRCKRKLHMLTAIGCSSTLMHSVNELTPVAPPPSCLRSPKLAKNAIGQL